MSGCYQSAGLSIVNVCLISVTILERILFCTVGVDKVIKIISFLSFSFPIEGNLLLLVVGCLDYQDGTCHWAY